MTTATKRHAPNYSEQTPKNTTGSNLPSNQKSLTKANCHPDENQDLCQTADYFHFSQQT
jgi:hypothetical protein